MQPLCFSLTVAATQAHEREKGAGQTAEVALLRLAALCPLLYCARTAPRLSAASSLLSLSLSLLSAVLIKKGLLKKVQPLSLYLPLPLFSPFSPLPSLPLSAPRRARLTSSVIAARGKCSAASSFSSGSSSLRGCWHCATAHRQRPTAELSIGSGDSRQGARTGSGQATGMLTEGEREGEEGEKYTRPRPHVNCRVTGLLARAEPRLDPRSASSGGYDPTAALGPALALHRKRADRLVPSLLTAQHRLHFSVATLARVGCSVPLTPRDRG